MVSAFPIFKTLTLGPQKGHKAYSRALKASGCYTGEYVDEILKNIQIARTPTQIHVVVVTTAELGFGSATRRDAIFARARERGLELCPAEVGPALRLAYHPDQPRKELLGRLPVGLRLGPRIS